MKIPIWPTFDPTRAWREKLNRPFRLPDPGQEVVNRLNRGFRFPDPLQGIEHDRIAAREAWERIDAWPARQRRRAATLTLRCPSCAVAATVVYGVDGRQLVWCRGEDDARVSTMWQKHADGSRTPVIEPGFHPYGAFWLETVPTGDDAPLECQCRCQRWRITGRQLRAALGGDTPGVVRLPL